VIIPVRVQVQGLVQVQDPAPAHLQVLVLDPLLLQIHQKKVNIDILVECIITIIIMMTIIVIDLYYHFCY
jgi:hypothetical protein